MSYRLFLYIITQIITNGRVKAIINGSCVEFSQNIYTKKWVITSQVSFGEGGHTQTIRECFPGYSKASFTNDGVCLIQDPKNPGQILLRQEINPIDKYKFFQTVLKDFLGSVEDWTEVFSVKP